MKSAKLPGLSSVGRARLIKDPNNSCQAFPHVSAHLHRGGSKKNTGAKANPQWGSRHSFCPVGNVWLKYKAVAEIIVMVFTNVSNSALSECRLGFYYPTRYKLCWPWALFWLRNSSLNSGDTCEFQEEAYKCQCTIQPHSSPLSQLLVMFQIVQVSVVFISE